MLSLDFTWTAPDTCPTRAEVVEQLSNAVDAGGKELPPLRARAVVSRDGASWQLELETELDGRRGTRLLEADSCEGLARAATLVLALTLGEGLARRQAEDEARAARPPEPAKPPPPPPVVSTPRAPKPREARRLAWLSVGVGSNPLGAVSPTAQLGLGYQPGLLRLSLALGATLPQTSELGETGSEARATALSAAVAACLVPALPPLRFVACGELSATLLRVQGRGTERDESVTVPLYGVGPSLGAEWWLGERAFFGLSLASRVSVKQPDLVVEASPGRRRLEALSGSALLGGGVRW